MEEKETFWSRYGPVFAIVLLVASIAFIRAQNHPEYKNYNQAISYIWQKVSTQKIVLDSTSYLYVSSLLDIETKTRELQIVKIVNSMEKENLYLKETRDGWTPKPSEKNERTIKIVFEKIK